MVDWKADLDSLMQDTAAFVQRVAVESPPPPTVVIRKNRPLSDWTAAEREEIKRRVATFKAHQERFMREREDHVAGELKRMRDRPRGETK
jgi:hypothetical protein